MWCARQTSLVPCSKGSQEIRVEGEARAWRLALLACGGVAVLGRRSGRRLSLVGAGAGGGLFAVWCVWGGVGGGVSD